MSTHDCFRQYISSRAIIHAFQIELGHPTGTLIHPLTDVYYNGTWRTDYSLSHKSEFSSISRLWQEQRLRIEVVVTEFIGPRRSSHFKNHIISEQGMHLIGILRFFLRIWVYNTALWHDLRADGTAKAPCFSKFSFSYFPPELSMLLPCGILRTGAAMNFPVFRVQIHRHRIPEDSSTWLESKRKVAVQVDLVGRYKLTCLIHACNVCPVLHSHLNIAKYSLHSLRRYLDPRFPSLPRKIVVRGSISLCISCATLPVYALWTIIFLCTCSIWIWWYDNDAVERAVIW